MKNLEIRAKYENMAYKEHFYTMLGLQKNRKLTHLKNLLKINKGPSQQGDLWHCMKYKTLHRASSFGGIHKLR